MATDVAAAFCSLAEIVARIKELREWQKLEQQEARPEVPPSFRISTDTDEDLRQCYNLFLSKDLELRRLLNSHTALMPVAGRSSWQERLHDLEEQVRGLGLAERFISP